MSFPTYPAPSLEGDVEDGSNVALTWDGVSFGGLEDAIVLLQAHTGTLIDAVGAAEITVVGDGAPSTSQVKFGTHSFGNPGTSFHSDYIQVRHHTVSGSDTYFGFGDEFTMEGWFYFESVPGTVYLFGVDRGDGSDSVILDSTGKVSLVLAAEGAASSSSGAVPNDQWTHIAVTRDADNLCRVFVNGIIVASATLTSAYATSVADGSGGTYSYNNIGFGAVSGNRDLVGFYDQIRYTKTCDYTADFEPPVVPFGEEADEYIVYRDGEPLAVVSGTTYTDTTATPGTHTYTVYVWDGDIASDPSDTLEFTVSLGEIFSEVVPFDDEEIFTGYLGGKLRGKIVACNGRNANTAKKCG